MSQDTTQSRCTQMLMHCASAFERSQQCQFIIDATLGTLDEEIWEHYICNELSFVHSVELLMKQLVGSVPNQDKPAWNMIIANLREEQVPYLSGLLGTQYENDASKWGEDVLSRHVANVTASGGYHAFAVSMCAAENLYQQWCRKAWGVQTTSGEPQLHEWIGMHVNASFHESVTFWDNTVDRMDNRIPDTTLRQWCDAMLDAEADFHNSAYANMSQSLVSYVNNKRGKDD